MGGLDGGQLGERDAQRLFDEHGLAGVERFDHEPRVCVVPGGHHHRVHRGIRNCAGRIRRRLGERQRDARRAERRVRPLLRARVLQKNPERRLAAAHDRVGRVRLLEGETMRDQGRHVEPAVGHHVEHGLEISLLGPAHESDRIVLPFLLVRGVVPTWPVRARYLERQLLLVEVVPGQLQTRHANQHDAPALPAHQRGLVHRLVALRRRGDDDGVDATATRETLRAGEGILSCRQVYDFRAEPARERKPAGVHVDTEDAAAVRSQQLDGDLPDQAKAGHDHGLPERRLREPDALQRDRANHCEGGALVGHGVRNLRAQVHGDADDLGVPAVRGDAIAGGQSGGAGPRLEHAADVAISERQQLIQLVPHGLDGGQQSVCLHLLEDHADLVWLLPRFLE